MPAFGFGFGFPFLQGGGSSDTLFELSPGADLSDLGMTFTRASAATYIDENGLVRFAPHNMLLSSNNIMDPAWGVYLPVKLGPNEIDFTGTGSAGALYQQVATPIDIPVTISIEVKCNSGTDKFRLGMNATLGPDLTATTEWQRFELTFNTGGPWSQFELRCAGSKQTGILQVRNAQVEHNLTASKYLPTTTVAVQGLRDEHYELDPVISLPVRTILLEGARTNVQVYSQRIGDAITWSSTPTPTLNFATAPDGTMTASKLASTGTGANYTYSGAAGGAQTSPYTQSFFVKYVDHPWVGLRWEVSTPAHGGYGWFNIQTGTLGTIQPGNVTHGIQKLANGWFRIWLICREGTFTAGAPVLIILSDTDNSTVAPAAGKSILVWGAQAEMGVTSPSSYIPTTTAAVTRAADNLTFDYQDAPQEMSVYVRGIELEKPRTQYAILWKIGPASISTVNTLMLYAQTAGDDRTLYMEMGGFVQSQLAPGGNMKDSKEFLCTLGKDGVVRVDRSINGAAAVSAPASSGLALAASFGGPYLGLWQGSAGSMFAYRDLVIAKGVRDLAWFREKIYTPPTPLVAPSITTVNPVVGSWVVVSPGVWASSGFGSVVFTYEWQLNGVSVGSATDAYLATAAGQATVIITATDSMGSQSVTTAPVTIAAVLTLSEYFSGLSGWDGGEDFESFTAGQIVFGSQYFYGLEEDFESLPVGERTGLSVPDFDSIAIDFENEPVGSTLTFNGGHGVPNIP